MITLAAFSELIALVYAAAASPKLWDQAVSRIHGVFAVTTPAVGQVQSTSLVFADGVSRSMTGTLSSEADRSYGEHYGRMDYVLQAVERGPVGVLRTGTELIKPRTRTEFYADWIRPNGLGDGVFVRLTAEPKPTSFLIAGSPDDEPFDTEERRQLMTLLVPHLQQALRTHRSLSTWAYRSGTLTDALDAVEHGIAIVTNGFRIVHLNNAAERLLGDRDGLVSQLGRLVASAPNARARLEVLLHRALDSDGDGLRIGGSMTCSRPSSRRPYALHVLPLSPQAIDLVSRKTVAMIVIVDPERRPRAIDDRLRQLYGFTATEAAVAQLVLNGEGLGPISDELMLSRDTVKTHMRHIFLKTGTHRQAELVRLLLAMNP